MATKAKDLKGRLHVVATNDQYAKLCQRSRNRMPVEIRNQIEVRACSMLKKVSLTPGVSGRTLFVSRLSDLPEERTSPLISAPGEWKQLLFLESLPAEAIPGRLLQLNIRKPQRLHVATEQNAERIGALLYRLFMGAARADAPQPIVDVWVEDSHLTLLASSFERLAVPLKALAKHIGTELREISTFEIDEDGCFLFWPHADVHLAWEQLLQIVDPAAAVAARQHSREFNVQYGAAIRACREERGLNQAGIAGLAERHLRRVEHGEQAATLATLQALATAHGLTLDAYLKILADRTRRN